MTAVAAPLTIASALVGGFSLCDTLASINKDLNSGKGVVASDVARLIGNVAGLVSSGVVIFSTGSALVIPLAVISAGAGTFQVIASVTGWRIGADGTATSTGLSAGEWVQAASQV